MWRVLFNVQASRQTHSRHASACPRAVHSLAFAKTLWRAKCVEHYFFRLNFFFESWLVWKRHMSKILRGSAQYTSSCVPMSIRSTLL